MAKGISKYLPPDACIKSVRTELVVVKIIVERGTSLAQAESAARYHLLHRFPDRKGWTLKSQHTGPQYPDIVVKATSLTS